jgi:hypothetical protein
MQNPTLKTDDLHDQRSKMVHGPCLNSRQTCDCAPRGHPLRHGRFQTIFKRAPGSRVSQHSVQGAKRAMVRWPGKMLGVNKRKEGGSHRENPKERKRQSTKRRRIGIIVVSSLLRKQSDRPPISWPPSPDLPLLFCELTLLRHTALKGCASH